MRDMFTRSTLWDVLAPALVLVAPIVAFVEFHGYGYFAIEILAGIGTAALVGAVVGLAVGKRPAWLRAGIIALLLTAYLDVQFYRVIQSLDGSWPAILLIGAFVVFTASGMIVRRHVTQIVTAVFGTIVATTLVFPPYGVVSRIVTADAPPMPGSDLPTVIHILLDEHIGVEGIPNDVDGGPELKAEIQSFYRRRGFYVFGKAFTRFEFSTWSISHMLNEVNDLGEDLFEEGRDGDRYKLKKSTYFDELEKSGYVFNIYQSNYLDFCSVVVSKSRKCLTYDFLSLNNLKSIPIHWAEKLRFLSVYLFSETKFYRSAATMYWSLSKFRDRSGALDAIWHGERINVVGSTASLEVFDFLEKDLPAAPRGTYFFAHLAIPHFPFVYDRNCNVSEPSLWTNGRIPRDVSKQSNTPRSRSVRYRRYFEQVRCVNKRLARLLDAIDSTPTLDDAVILIHGDHGSRITVDKRKRHKQGRAETSDYIATFSTLLAIRSAGIRPGYGLDPLPIQGLLDRLRGTGFNSLPDSRDPPMPQTIFLMPHVVSLEQDDNWITIPMPEFGAAGAK